MMGWYVPFYEDHAIMYHGHEDPHDHSACGPQIFCCPRAADLLKRSYPNSFAPPLQWDFADGSLIASWMGGDGPVICYFFFCDPVDREVLRFCGVEMPEVRDVLLKRRPLDPYLDIADRIRAPDA
jgi:hypothetical protein